MSEQTVYGGGSTPRVSRTKVRTHHLQKWKSEGHKWAMLTAYDFSTARVFDEAGIPVLLVGDSAANVVYGYDTTVPVTVDELIPAGARRRARCAARAGGRRPAVRQLRRPARAGAGHRDPVHEGDRRARGEAGGRRAGRRSDRDVERRPASR